MLTTKVFQSGNSQALRIPKEVRTDKEEFFIRRFGEGYVIYPVDDPWFPVRETMGTFPKDFLSDRNQPLCSEVPEREGL